MDCGKKLFFFLSAQEPPDGFSFPLRRGISLHESVEKYLHDGVVEVEDEFWDHWNKIEPYLDQIRDDVALVEEPLAREDGTFKATGRLDCMTHDGRIKDWKFVGKPWKADRFLDYVEKQGNLYLWLARGKGATGLDYIVVPENGKIQTWELEWDDTRIAQGLALWRVNLEKVRAAIRNNMFDAEPSPWRCRWCNYREMCPSKIV